MFLYLLNLKVMYVLTCIYDREGAGKRSQCRFLKQEKAVLHVVGHGQVLYGAECRVWSV